VSYMKRASELSIKMGSDTELQDPRSDSILLWSRLGQVPSLQHAIANQYGAVLTELYFSEHAGVWTARVKADFDGFPMVAWLDVGTFVRTVEHLCACAHMGHIPWQRDKRPPRR